METVPFDVLAVGMRSENKSSLSRPRVKSRACYHAGWTWRLGRRRIGDWPGSLVRRRARSGCGRERSQIGLFELQKKRRGWDLNLCRPNALSKLQILICHTCHRCHECRRPLHAIARQHLQGFLGCSGRIQSAASLLAIVRSKAKSESVPHLRNFN